MYMLDTNVIVTVIRKKDHPIRENLLPFIHSASEDSELNNLQIVCSEMNRAL